VETSLPKINRKALIAIVAVVTIVAGVSLYWFSWRPSNDEYTTTSQLLKIIDGTSKALTVELSANEYPANITPATPIKLLVLSDTISKAVDALNNSAPINRDFALGATYRLHQAKIAEYKQSASQLAESLKAYIAVTNNCGNFTDPSTGGSEDSYSAFLATCRDTIDQARKAKHKAFNEQFLTEFLDLTSEFISATDKVHTTEDNATFTASRQKMTELSQEIFKTGGTAVDFKLPNISSSLKELADKTESQSKAFLR
jgi:hypothetical protein